MGDAEKALAGLALLRNALELSCLPPGHLSPRTPHSSPSKHLVTRQVSAQKRKTAAPCGIAWNARVASIAARVPSSFVVGSPLSFPACQMQFAPSTPRCAIPTPTKSEPVWRILPMELLQSIMNDLPTFGQRARICATCKTLRGLEWRLASPLRLDEELSGIDLGDVGAKAVAWVFVRTQVVPIRELCLGRNNIGDLGARAIAAMLKGDASIRRLSLRHNKIHNSGAVALAAALSVNRTLEELDIWGNCLSDVGKQALISSAKCKVFLELDSPTDVLTRRLEGKRHAKFLQ